MSSNLTLAQCFAILNLPETASFEEIKAAHLMIAIQLHPDRYADKPRLRQVAEEELKTVNAAFDFLERHLGKTSSRDRARTGGTYTASGGAGSRWGSYTNETWSRPTNGPGQSQSSSSGAPPGHIPRILTLVRLGKKIALPLLIFSIGCIWFGMSLFKTYVIDPYTKVKVHDNRTPYDRRVPVPTVPPQAASHPEQTPPRDEASSQPKTALDPLSPERRAEIFETTRVYAYPPSQSEQQFGVDEHKWSADRRRWVAILTAHEPDPYTVRVLETQGGDSKIEFVIRNQTLSGWVKSKQIATIVP